MKYVDVAFLKQIEMAGKKYDINRWVFLIDIEDVRSEEYDENGSERICCLCGKDLTHKNKTYVHLINYGDQLVSSDMEFDSDLGFLEIGNTCKKKLPNNFYWKESNLFGK